MPLKKVVFKPGVDKETTRYSSEGGWYDSDKVRFRSGFPEKIGGWAQISTARFLGVCRSLFNWVTLGGLNIMAIGTNLKYYVERAGVYYDITPLRDTTAAGDVTFAATNGSPIITVTDNSNDAAAGDFVTFSGVDADGLGAGGNITQAVLEQNYQIASIIDGDNYTIIAKDPTTGAPVSANASDTGDGGAAVVAAYEIKSGGEDQQPFLGWGAGPWGTGTWSVGTTTSEPIRLWSQSNFGENLVFGPRGGPMYYWKITGSPFTTRAVRLDDEIGATDVPTIQNYILVSDAFRFVFAFGANDYGSPDQDPMLIRWSEQESAINWTPSALTQAGSLRLSTGSKIVTAIQSRQEVLVWTDSAMYSLQYIGANTGVWGASILGSNLSIFGQNTVAIASGVSFWMGVDKFYMYDGAVKTLNCDLRRHVFGNINTAQADQFFAGTNEAFNEVWWFYCSKDSQTIDRYVVYNYLENIWYHGTMARTAWNDSGLRNYPTAATYTHNLVEHENGNDDNETGTPAPINAYITTAEFDIDDGHNFGFIWRMLPDITFEGSTGTESPAAMFSLIPLQNSGSGYNNPASVGGSNEANVARSATIPVERFTGQIYTRVRGRQLVFKVESNQLGTAWQLGSPRLDIRPDGRR